jgi:hypothetical protein
MTDVCNHKNCVMHQFPSGEIWKRCLTCATTWKNVKASMAQIPTDVPSVTTTFKIYVDKYLDVASGGRVKFDYMRYGSGAFLRFHCSYCTQNWNVSTSLFGNLDGTSIPTELTNWVEEHKHICASFNPGGAQYSAFTSPTNKCTSCGWAFNQHKEAQPVWDVVKNTWVVPYTEGKPLPTNWVAVAPAPTKPTNVYEPVKGRRFREETE